MAKFKVGDKVVFKKEVLDKFNKTGKAESYEGISLTKGEYDYLINNPVYKSLGYFEVKGFGV